MTTYSVVQRSKNSWQEHDGVRVYTIVNDCGHKHRTVSAAAQCLSKLSTEVDGMMPPLGYFGHVEDSDGNVVDEDALMDASA